MVNISNIVSRIIKQRMRNILISSYILKNIIEIRKKAQLVLSSVQRGIIFFIK